MGKAYRTSAGPSALNLMGIPNHALTGVDFCPASTLKVKRDYRATIFRRILALKWFDYWLKEKDNGMVEESRRFRIFVMGANVWRRRA